jgi:hypothetical protein
LATPVTTFGAIRDQLVTTIKALTPARLASSTYRFAPRIPVEYHDEANNLRGWAEENPSDCFRVYDVVQQGWLPSGTSDGDIQGRMATLELVVAYPDLYGLYGVDGSAEQADVMEADISQVAATVGLHGAGNWVSGATPMEPEEVTFEDGENVRFAVLTLGFHYYYDTV